MGMMFDPVEIKANFDTYLANGAYMAFERVGEYYGLGQSLMMLYALCNMIGQFSTLVISIDAPLRMLLDDPKANQFIPKALLKKNENGAFVNGIKMIVVLSGGIILAQRLVPGAATVLKQLTKLNSITMPARYLWVFLAYLFLRKQTEKFSREYMFVKNNKVARFFGFWCFGITFLCCAFGMYSTDTFQFALNVCVPFVLVALGLILPMIRRSQDAKGI